MFKTDNVFTAVWIGVLSLSFNTYHFFKNNNKEITIKDYYFSQADIRNEAQKFCTKNIQQARIHQWTNGDHPNCSYKYLRANQSKRRVTAIGEFNGYKEMPQFFSSKDNENINIKSANKDFNLSDLIEWHKTIYTPFIQQKIETNPEMRGPVSIQKSNLDYNESKNENENLFSSNIKFGYFNDYENEDKIGTLIHKFIGEISKNKIEIYNEASVQYELAIYLKEFLKNVYKIQLERNISFFQLSKRDFIKKEMDIAIYKEDFSERYAIEIKFPTQGQFPEQMFAICKDIRFLEDVKNSGFNKCYSLNIVNSKLFYCSKGGTPIYEMFRVNKKISGVIKKPTGNEYAEIYIQGEYKIKWYDIDDIHKYFLITI
jgi:hypothetical protein